MERLGKSSVEVMKISGVRFPESGLELRNVSRFHSFGLHEFND